MQLPLDFDFFIGKYFPRFLDSNMTNQASLQDITNTYNELKQHLRTQTNIYLKYYITTQVLKFVQYHGRIDNFLSKLFEYLNLQEFKSSFQCGDPVGNLTGGFTCRESTQSTLNSFHSAGKKLVSGIKRARQLAEKQSSIQTFVYIKDKQQKTYENMQAFSKHISQRYLIDVFEEISSDNAISKVGMELIDIIFDDKVKDKNDLPMNFKKFQIKDASLIDHFSKKQVILDLYKQGFVSFFNDDNELIIMKDKKKKIKDLLIGCKGVISCDVHRTKDLKFYIFEVQDLSNIMHLDLDFNTLWCSNPFQMEKYFGCLMGTKTMIHELCENSKGVDPRWNRFIALLMFQTGQSLPITSHGMLKAYNEVDTISAAAFERPRIVLSNAAFFEGKASTTCSSTASILSVPQYNTGTSSVDLLDSFIDYQKKLELSESTSSKSFLFMDRIQEFMHFIKKKPKKVKPAKISQGKISVQTLNEELNQNKKRLKKTYITNHKKQKRKLHEMNKTLSKDLFFEKKKKSFDFNEKAVQNFFEASVVDDVGFNFKMPRLFS